MTVVRHSARRYTAGIFLACVTGFALSYYSYVVETAKEKNEAYEAMCDISEHMSCTKAFMSEYGKGFGVIPKTSPLYQPNSIYGIGFYTIIAMISLFNNYPGSIIVIILGILSCLMSVYLAGILYLLKNICVICVSTYVVNAIILILAIKKHRKLFYSNIRKRKNK